MLSHTISQIAKRFVTGGLEAALGRKEQVNRHKKIDGRMEDVLDVSQRPYDPLRPVVCLDETNRQLIKKWSIPPKPGSPEREDYEYHRCGVPDLFIAFEPLACKRVVKLTDTRTAMDFAHFLRELVDLHYNHCEEIVLVMDN